MQAHFSLIEIQLASREDFRFDIVSVQTTVLSFAMVRITRRICMAVLVSGFAFGLPRPDEILNEAVVPAPYGIPMTHSVES